MTPAPLYPRLRRTAGFALPAGLAAVACICACARPPTSPKSPAPASAPAVALDSPEAAARSLLLCLREEVHAVRSRDRARAADAARRAAAVVAADEIESLLRGRPQLRVLVGKDPVLGTLRIWSAAIAYYADRFVLDELRTIPPPDHPGAAQSRRATVRVPAPDAGDDTWIELRCLRSGDGSWRVASIDFWSPSATSRPHSRGS